MFLKRNTLKNILIELNVPKISKIYEFELGIRNQKIESNIPLLIHSLATYKITYNQGSASYFTKNQFYSLCEDLIDVDSK